MTNKELIKDYNIGIEVELSSHLLPRISDESITSIGDDILMIGDKEYYSSTNEITFNLPYSMYHIDKCKEYVRTTCNKKTYTTLCKGEDHERRYTGTHVHLFSDDLYFKIQELSTSQRFYLDTMVIGKVAKFAVENELHHSELSRLSGSHHILGTINTQTQYVLDKLRELACKNRLPYRQLQDSRRYASIIASPSTDRGKPKSIEIRCIPNTILFKHTEFMIEIIQFTEELVNNPELIQPIGIKWYADLIRGEGNSNSTNSVFVKNNSISSSRISRFDELERMYSVSRAKESRQLIHKEVEKERKNRVSLNELSENNYLLLSKEDSNKAINKYKPPLSLRKAVKKIEEEYCANESEEGLISSDDEYSAFCEELAHNLFNVNHRVSSIAQDVTEIAMNVNSMPALRSTIHEFSRPFGSMDRVAQYVHGLDFCDLWSKQKDALSRDFVERINRELSYNSVRTEILF